MSAPLLLHHKLKDALNNWRSTDYTHTDYPAIGEILRWAAAPHRDFHLRAPQLMALECYWYLRLVLDTSHIIELYAHFFPEDQSWAHALAIPPRAWQDTGENRATFVHRMQTDESFVRQYRLESMRETFALTYPSYIFALAMGVGKTVLIGSLIASEFALALTYPDGPFLRNALVFAPGRTIVESLRELIHIPYGALLPPHLHKPFAASIKFTLPQDGERTIPILPGSAYNIVITNTEKIRIQKEKIRKNQIGAIWRKEQIDEAKKEVANLRLQTIASLPNLGIFSDEAHHTYGRALGKGLKKVRKTVDYIAAQTDVRIVVNTTGTPYYGRRPLHDVIASYTLSAGIRDGILKEVGDNLIIYEMGKSGREKQNERSKKTQTTIDPGDGNISTQLALTLRDILTDFFATYGDVTLPDGTPAKLAIYFPKTVDIAVNRPLLEQLVVELGYAPTVLLEHHTHCENKEDFDRFRTRRSPHRVALLVDRGVEGWDVPALFACALVRKLKTSNNFVLQAASRCLRQVPGNTLPARIYLSAENEAILARQLRTTYGDSLVAIAAARPRKRQVHHATPTTMVTERRMLPKQRWQVPATLILHPPTRDEAILPQHATLAQSTPLRRRRSALWGGAVQSAENTQEHREEEQSHVITEVAPDEVSLIDRCHAAVALASTYHLPLLLVYQALCQGYQGDRIFPMTDLPFLRRQIEHQCQQITEADDA